MPTQNQEQNNIYGGQQQLATHVDSQNQYFYGDEFAKKILERDQHPITVVVTGAGVDATMGIPTSSALIPRIAEFLETDEGKTLDALLRKAIGHVRFHFDKFVEHAIDSLAKNLDRELRDICSNVKGELDHNDTLSEDHRKLGQLIVRLFHKIIEVKEGATIDPDTERLIGEVFGTSVKDDTIIDFSRLSYTETFKTVIVEILKKSMHESANPILRHVYRNILDIEQLLTKYFFGFYDGRDSYIRDYMYISWMLWAYLVSEERRIATGSDEKAVATPTVYSQLQGHDLQFVTFNYTSFARRTKTDSLYFHGSLMEYVDVENKNDIAHEDLQGIDLTDFFENRLAKEISFGGEGDRRSLPIPSFLPPLKIQTVISKRYIDAWYQTGEMLRHAKKVILLGLNLGTVDPYFGDMLRESEAPDIIVVDQDLEATSTHLCRLFQLLPTAYSRLQIAGHEARKYNNRLTVIQGDIGEVDLAEIL